MNVTDATFEQEVLNSDQPVLVDFWAPWCGPCKAAAPVLDSIAQQYKGKLKVAKLNVDENPLMTGKYGIRGIPAFKFFKQGTVVDQITGFAGDSEIEEKVKEILG